METRIDASKTMTQEQIDEAVESYRALLEKHASEFGAAAVQQALGQSGLADEQFDASKTMTQDQIDEAVESYRALLETQASEFGAAAVQQALGQSGLADEQFAAFRQHVGLFRNCIVRRTKVNRRRSPQAALDATGRRQYTDDEVVKSMPVGGSDEVDVVFFKPEPWETRSGFMSDDDLEKACARRNLMSDPCAVAAANEDDPTFADNHPNAAHWRDAEGKWCFVAFDRWGVGRRVRVRRDGGGWHGDWLFSGSRKCTSSRI